MAITRYSAGIQRAKGLLEIAAALYDTSLSHKTRRAAEGVLQVNSRLGRDLGLSLRVRESDRRKDLPVAMTTGGFQEIIDVARDKYALTWVNPSVLLTMAYRGKGPFKKRLPVRALAVFPSFDVMGFAVHRDTGITSVEQIKKERFPLRVSTGLIPPSDLEGSATMFTVAAVLRCAGFSLADMRNWGGKIHPLPRPSDPRRRATIENGTINAIFDEGIKSWGQTALANGFRYLPVEGAVLRRLTALGYRATGMSRCGFRGLTEEIQTLDFSGWPMVVHADMPVDLAYALCEAIEMRKGLIPTDNFKRLSMRQLCANDGEAPLDVPFHPGASRFYRERGFIR